MASSMTSPEAATPPAVAAALKLVREILVAVCERDGLSLASGAEPGEPARNYELALRLGIGRVFGLPDAGADSARQREISERAEEIHAEHHYGVIVPSLDSCAEHERADYEALVASLIGETRD